MGIGHGASSHLFSPCFRRSRRTAVSADISDSTCAAVISTYAPLRVVVGMGRPITNAVPIVSCPWAVLPAISNVHSMSTVFRSGFPGGGGWGVGGFWALVQTAASTTAMAISAGRLLLMGHTPRGLMFRSPHSVAHGEYKANNREGRGPSRYFLFSGESGSRYLLMLSASRPGRFCPRGLSTDSPSGCVLPMPA